MQKNSSFKLPSGTPGCLKKRQLLNDQELSPALCREYGEKFLTLGWWDDALDFFRKAQDPEGLEKIIRHGLETGDAFLLARTGEQAPDIWLRVAEKAKELGKIHFARRALEMAGETEKAAALAPTPEAHPGES